MTSRRPHGRAGLRRALEDVLATDGEPRVDVTSLIRRGQRRRTLRLVLGSSLAVVLLAGVTFAATLAFSEARPRVPTEVAGHPHLDDAQIAKFFAIQALDAAGMLPNNGDKYGVERIDYVGDVWEADLGILTCVANDSIDTCVAKAGGDASMTIDVQNNEFVVVDAKGDIEEERKNKLVGYRDDLSRLPTNDPYWVFTTPQLDGDRIRRLSSTFAWAGPIPYPGVAVNCRAVVLDANGSVAWQGEPIELPPPSTESGRFGSGTGWMDPPLDLSDPYDAHVECESYEAGWELSKAADAVRVDQVGPETIAQVDLEWHEPAYFGIFTRCTVAVTDKAGAVIAEGSDSLPGPKAEGSPPYKETLTIFLSGSMGGADHVDASCTPITPVEFELGASQSTEPEEVEPTPSSVERTPTREESQRPPEEGQPSPVSPTPPEPSPEA